MLYSQFGLRYSGEHLCGTSFVVLLENRIPGRDVLRLIFSNGADFGFSAALSGSIRGLKKVADIRISGYPNIRIFDLQTDFKGTSN